MKNPYPPPPDTAGGGAPLKISSSCMTPPEEDAGETLAGGAAFFKVGVGVAVCSTVGKGTVGMGEGGTTGGGITTVSTACWRFFCTSTNSKTLKMITVTSAIIIK